MKDALKSNDEGTDSLIGTVNEALKNVDDAVDAIEEARASKGKRRKAAPESEL
jgi:hypothetical protein